MKIDTQDLVDLDSDHHGSRTVQQKAWHFFRFFILGIHVGHCVEAHAWRVEHIIMDRSEPKAKETMARISDFVSHKHSINLGEVLGSQIADKLSK